MERRYRCAAAAAAAEQETREKEKPELPRKTTTAITKYLYLQNCVQFTVVVHRSIVHIR